MPWTKLKNIILLILVMTNLFLLVFVLGQAWQNDRAREQTWENALLFLRELLRFNDMSAESPLEPGTTVYLARKKARGTKEVPKYVVGRDGETLWEISQRFGIRLSSLARLNPQLADTPLQEGDTVQLRKEK